MKCVSCLLYRADLRAAAVLTATGADDCHAPEQNVTNDEMNNWMWIDVDLVIISDVGWPTASLVTDRRRRRQKGARGRRKVRLQGKININKKFGLNVRFEPCTSEATHGDVHAEGGARDPFVFKEVPG